MREKCKKSCKCGEKLPDLEKTFPDGSHYRIEVSGIEKAEILEAGVDEAQKLKIPIHRAIATVAGSLFYSDKQLRDLAAVAAKNKIEVIICPGDLAHGFFGNPNRNLNFQNIREANIYVEEILRCTKIGFRGFLVWTSPMLRVLSSMRFHGQIPRDTIFKVSTFANSCNAVDFRSHTLDGADTINAANGLKLASFSEIRQGLIKQGLSEKTAIDVHITFWQNLLMLNEKGRLELVTEDYNRIQDAPEIARICSPVYFKFEKGTPGIEVYNVPRHGWTFKDLAEHKRHDVRTAAYVIKAVKRKYSSLKLSDWGPEDLRVPKVSFTGPVRRIIRKKVTDEQK